MKVDRKLLSNERETVGVLGFIYEPIFRWDIIIMVKSFS